MKVEWSRYTHAHATCLFKTELHLHGTHLLPHRPFLHSLGRVLLEDLLLELLGLLNLQPLQVATNLLKPFVFSLVLAELIFSGLQL